MPAGCAAVSSDAMIGDDALGQTPSAPHEDLPVDRRAAFLSAIRFASVAAIGGLLFGYDISVTNRCSQGVAGQLSHRQRPVGFRRGIGSAGCRDRSGVGRPVRRPDGSTGDDEAFGHIVFRVRARRRVGKQHLDVRRLSPQSAASVSASRRSRPRPTSPRSRPRGSAVGSAHCSNSPSCAVFSGRWR